MSANPQASVVARGLGWSALYQAFVILLNLGGMLILVRIIRPAEYGRASAVVGYLSLIGVIKGATFVEQALQLPRGVEPDWSLHWSAALYIHLALFLVCEGLAGAFWLLPNYQPIAPLLHLGGVGLLFEPASTVRTTMLRRNLDFARLRKVGALANFLATGLTLGLGIAGAGAYAIVAGNNVALAVPFAIDLFLFNRFRPTRGFWAWPRWADYRPALRFGFQHAATSLLAALRSGLEAIILPAVLGYTAMGLLNRAIALFSISVGRLLTMVTETVYPLLPLQAREPNRFASRASLFARGLLVVALAGAVFLGWQGPALSRLLYGLKWVEADPLLWPGALLGLGGALFAIGGSILLAVNRLRACFAVHLVVTLLGCAALLGVVVRGGLRDYAWMLAVAQLIGGLLACVLCLRHLGPGALASALPALVSTAAGSALLALVVGPAARLPLPLNAAVNAAAFGLGTTLGLRLAYPDLTHDLLARMPGGDRVNSWLRLRAPLASAG